jgi:hypothetical protein
MERAETRGQRAEARQLERAAATEAAAWVFGCRRLMILPLALRNSTRTGTCGEVGVPVERTGCGAPATRPLQPPATWEREIMLERQREGIAKAKAAGKYKDRPVTIDAAEIRQLRAELGPAAIAKRLGIARSSVYRALA